MTTAAPQLALDLAARRPPTSIGAFGPPFVHAPLARASDPETAHRAAEGYLAAAEVQNAQICAALDVLGAGGWTYVEIAEALGWDDPVVVARRLAALRQAGLIHLVPGKRAAPGHRPMQLHVSARWAYGPRRAA